MNDDEVFITELQRHFDTEPLYKSLTFYNKNNQYHPLVIAAFNGMTIIMCYPDRICYMMFYTGSIKSINKEMKELNALINEYTYPEKHKIYACSGTIEFKNFNNINGIGLVIDYIVKFNISQLRKYNEDMKMKTIKKIS